MEKYQVKHDIETNYLRLLGIPYASEEINLATIYDFIDAYHLKTIFKQMVHDLLARKNQTIVLDEYQTMVDFVIENDQRITSRDVKTARAIWDYTLPVFMERITPKGYVFEQQEDGTYMWQTTQQGGR